MRTHRYIYHDIIKIKSDPSSAVDMNFLLAAASQVG